MGDLRRGDRAEGLFDWLGDGVSWVFGFEGRFDLLRVFFENVACGFGRFFVGVGVDYVEWGANGFYIDWFFWLFRFLWVLAAGDDIDVDG